MRVHQDFTANVLRGGKPHITTDVRAELEGQELSLEEFQALDRTGESTPLSRWAVASTR